MNKGRSCTLVSRWPSIDPYDCALTPNIKSLPDEETEAVRAAYLSQERLTEQQRHEFKTKTTQELREMLLRAAHGAIKQSTDAFLKNRGVTCFSEKNNDLLMRGGFGNSDSVVSGSLA